MSSSNQVNSFTFIVVMGVRLNKIFGIGLPKSGTSSLHEALKILGFRSLHYADDRTTDEVREAKYRLSVLERFDAILDVPIPSIFPQLDQEWPGSKFILTTRPVDAWIESSRRAGFNQGYASPRRGSAPDFQRIQLFGCSVFHEARYRWVYESHHRLVREYFSGPKSNQLLILDFGVPIDWMNLCRFLECPVPEIPFPHANQKSRRKELSVFERRAVETLVRLGVDYRWLRSMNKRLFRKDLK